MKFDIVYNQLINGEYGSVWSFDDSEFDSVELKKIN